MDYLRVGKYVNTHGLKGEIKVISDISDCQSIFNINNTVYIGENKIPFIITSYRKHQKYDMITLKDLDSIDKILPYKGSNIYIDKDNVNIPLFEDLLDYEVYNNDKYIGKVIELLKGVKYDFIVVGESRIIIPYIDNFIKDVDNINKIIKTSYLI